MVHDLAVVEQDSKVPENPHVSVHFADADSDVESEAGDCLELCSPL